MLVTGTFEVNKRHIFGKSPDQIRINQLQIVDDQEEQLALINLTKFRQCSLRIGFSEIEAWLINNYLCISLSDGDFGNVVIHNTRTDKTWSLDTLHEGDYSTFPKGGVMIDHRSCGNMATVFESSSGKIYEIDYDQADIVNKHLIMEHEDYIDPSMDDHDPSCIDIVEVVDSSLGSIVDGHLIWSDDHGLTFDMDLDANRLTVTDR